MSARTGLLYRISLARERRVETMGNLRVIGALIGELGDRVLDWLEEKSDKEAEEIEEIEEIEEKKDAEE